MSFPLSVTPGARTHQEAAAYHEAGHAVVGLLLGMRVTEVCIDRRWPGTGWTVTRPVPSQHGHHRGPWPDTPFRWTRRLNHEQREAVYALAGPLAEAKAFGMPLRTLGAISDLEDVYQLMRGPESQENDRPHGAVRSGAKAFFVAEIRRTRRILSRPSVWRAVTMIARDLLCWYSLMGDDVVETTQWALSDHRQFDLFPLGYMPRTVVISRHGARRRAA